MGVASHVMRACQACVSYSLIMWVLSCITLAVVVLRIKVIVKHITLQEERERERRIILPTYICWTSQTLYVRRQPCTITQSNAPYRHTKTAIKSALWYHTQNYIIPKDSFLKTLYWVQTNQENNLQFPNIQKEKGYDTMISEQSLLPSAFSWPFYYEEPKSPYLTPLQWTQGADLSSVIFIVTSNWYFRCQFTRLIPVSSLFVSPFGRILFRRQGRNVCASDRRKVGMKAKYRIGLAAELITDIKTFTFWKK